MVLLEGAVYFLSCEHIRQRVCHMHCLRRQCKDLRLYRINDVTVPYCSAALEEHDPFVDVDQYTIA